MSSGARSAVLDSQARATLADLADVLIPAGDGMPSASAAGVAGALLDRVLTARPDLAEPLERLLIQAQGLNPVAIVEQLRADDPGAFAVLATVVPGGYFMSEEVRRRIGYTGQTPKPIETDDPPDYLPGGLLASVIDRGPIYRPTPRVIWVDEDERVRRE